MSDKQLERVKEIRKAIALLGWSEVNKRIRSREDRTIFNKLSKEFDARMKAEGDKVLEQHQIKF